MLFHPTVLTTLGILAVYPDFDVIIAGISSFFPVMWGMRSSQEELLKKKHPYKDAGVLGDIFLGTFLSVMLLGLGSKTGVDLASMGVSNPLLTGAVVGLGGFTLGTLSDYIRFYFSKNKQRRRELMMYLQQRNSTADPEI